MIAARTRPKRSGAGQRNTGPTPRNKDGNPRNNTSEGRAFFKFLLLGILEHWDERPGGISGTKGGSNGR
ncbi:MAG: hypothetical protein ACI8W8_003375 [Rhodothermales bacterium]|jgi:hypothetical protein